MIFTRPKYQLAYGGIDKHSWWKVCLVMVWYMKSHSVAVTVWRKTYVGNLDWAFLCILVEFDDDAALFKTVEAFRGTFFFSTSVELKTKSAGGGGAGHEMIN